MVSAQDMQDMTLHTWSETLEIQRRVYVKDYEWLGIMHSVQDIQNTPYLVHKRLYPLEITTLSCVLCKSAGGLCRDRIIRLPSQQGKPLETVQFS